MRKKQKNYPDKMNDIIQKVTFYHGLNRYETEELQRGYSYLEAHDPAHIEHALDTARFIAENRFDYAVVLAAILHDFGTGKKDPDSLYTLKRKFNNETIHILRVYREIHQKVMKDCGNPGIENSLKQENYYSEALFIQISEAIILMEQADSSESRKQLFAIAGAAKNHLIPEAKNIKAFLLVDTLENLCLKIEKNEMYTAIIQRLAAIQERNGRYQNMILTQIEQIFDKNSKIIPDALQVKDQPYIKKIIKNKRSVSSIARHIEKHARNQPYDFEKLMDKKELPCWDITLILEDDIEESELHPKDIFFDYYTSYLQSALQIYVLGYYETTYRDSDYFVLCDAMDNLYRIFIKTEEAYLCYCLGSYIEKDKFRLNYNSKDDAMIKVFKKDGSATMIKEGASVLDFAFMIHGNLGLHFDYALLNNNQQHCPPYTRLNKGDTVEIKESSEITAELKWFRYIKTTNASEQLIRHFNKLKQNQFIKVYTRDGTADSFENGATVLDLAFRIHTNLGLHFDYALINGNARHYPAFTQLNDGDSVIIIASDSVTADLQWFKYLKTDQAVNKLIKYFKNSIQRYVWLTENTPEKPVT